MTDRIDALLQQLSQRDLAIIAGVNQYRFLTTQQVARRHFDVLPDTAIPRRANHALARLRSLGVVATLNRRIGGVRAGSAGYVWTVTDVGRQIVAANSSDVRPPRIRAYEPSLAFLEHTLAVAETALVADEAARRGLCHVEALEVEPEAWRSYVGPTGAIVRLKPDLGMVTEAGGFEDRWFIEVDRDTEPPSRIIAKCLAYERYRATGIEQRDRGIFPATVWIVPSPRRATQLRERIASDSRLLQQNYAVITLDKFPAILSSGLEDFNQKESGQKGGEPS
jgi:hypothetical protein